jgi:hypothetical protein
MFLIFIEKTAVYLKVCRNLFDDLSSYCIYNFLIIYHELRVFENAVLRRKFDLKGREVESVS